MIVDLNILLDFESDQNQRSNWDFKFDSTMTICSGTPDRISLDLAQQMYGQLYYKNPPFWLNICQQSGRAN